MNLRPPFGQRVLVLAAHADDEVVGALGWLHEGGGPAAIAFLTDSAPAARWRPPSWSGRRAYRLCRRREARCLWQRQHRQARLFFAGVPDQRLMYHLPSSAAWLARLARRVRPSLLLAPAFEGGHPDHDAANLLAAQLGRRFGVPVWEYALYTARNGQIFRQCFPSDSAWSLPLAAATAAAKRSALAVYASQAATLALFGATCEAMRPLPAHDYRRPPHVGATVYELWEWPWHAQGVAQHFARYLDAT